MSRIPLSLVLPVVLWFVVTCSPGRADDERPGDLQPVLPVSQVRILNFQNYGSGGSFVLAPDGKTLVMANNSFLTVYDLARGKQPAQPRNLAVNNMNLYNAALAFAPDGKSVAALAPNNYQDGSIYLWDVKTGKEIRQIDNDEPYFGLAFSPGGKTLALGTNQRLEIWDLATTETVRTIALANNSVCRLLAFSPDAKMLATADNGPSIHVWETATGKERCEFHLPAQPGQQHPRFGPVFYQNGMNTPVCSLAFSADGGLLAAGGADSTVHVWDLKTGRELPPLSSHQAPVCALVFTADGKRLSSFDSSGLSLVWNARRLGHAPAGKLPHLGDAEFEDLWTDLGEGDGFRTYRAVRYFVADPDRALAFFRKHLEPVPAGDVTRINQLVSDLQSGNGSQRRKAMAELRKHGEAALGALSMLPEAQKQNRPVQMMLQKLEAQGDATDRLRGAEAVQALEEIGTDDAKQLLEKLSRGAPGARLTAAARAAIDRMAKGKASGPEKIESALRETATQLAEPGANAAAAKEALHALEPLWADLGSADAGRAFRAIQLLRRYPAAAVLLLQEHLTPAAGVDSGRVEQLIADLDSDNFETREKASRELQNLGRLAEPALRKALDRLSLEARRRAQPILEKIDRGEASPEDLQRLRAVEVLEGVATPAARRLLAKLAGGASAARSTQDSQAALGRLAARAPAAP